MTANENQTAGRELTAALRRYFSVGPRTRRYRDHRDLHAEMIELAAQYPGYYVERTQTALRAGFGAAISYDKHVSGHRIAGTLAYRISAMSPWHFAGLLGQMVDASVECTGDGERFFSAMARL